MRTRLTNILCAISGQWQIMTQATARALLIGRHHNFVRASRTRHTHRIVEEISRVAQACSPVSRTRKWRRVKRTRCACCTCKCIRIRVDSTFLTVLTFVWVLSNCTSLANVLCAFVPRHTHAICQWNGAFDTHSVWWTFYTWIIWPVVACCTQHTTVWFQNASHASATFFSDLSSGTIYTHVVFYLWFVSSSFTFDTRQANACIAFITCIALARVLANTGTQTLCIFSTPLAAAVGFYVIIRGTCETLSHWCWSYVDCVLTYGTCMAQVMRLVLCQRMRRGFVSTYRTLHTLLIREIISCHTPTVRCSLRGCQTIRVIDTCSALSWTQSVCIRVLCTTYTMLGARLRGVIANSAWQAIFVANLRLVKPDIAFRTGV